MQAVNSLVAICGLLGLPCLAQVTPPASTQSVTVTADRGLSGVFDPSTSVVVLSTSQLNAPPVFTLDDRLRQVAGFQLFRRTDSWTANPTSQGVSLRGLGSTAASRSLVVSDQTPFNDPFGGWVHWNEIPELAIREVVVERGGASNLYGSSAIGGVLDVVPVTAKQKTLQAEVLGASRQTVSGNALGILAAEHFASLAALNLFTTAGYIPTAPSFRGSVDTAANVTSQTGRLELRSFGKAVDGFLRGNVLNESRHNGTPLQTNGTRLWRYSGGLDVERSGLSGLLRLYGSRETYRQSFSAIAADRNSERLTRLQRVPVDELGAATQARVLFHTVVVALGADVHDIRATDDERAVAGGAVTSTTTTSARQRTVGSFAAGLWQPGRWTISSSLRADLFRNFDGITLTAPAGTRTLQPVIAETVLSPRLGVARTLPHGVLLFGNAFRAFRSPTLNELYRTGQVGQQTTLANASLRSERATGFELGGEVHGKGLSLRTSYFWTEVNRPVSTVLLAQTATQQTLQRQNLGQIRSRGLSLEASTQPWHGLATRIGYQFAVATVTRYQPASKLQANLLGRWIPEVPRQSVTAQVNFHARYADLHGYMIYSGRQFDDAENQFVLHPFSRFDLSAEHTFQDHLVIFGGVQNLLNRSIDAGRTPILTLAAPRIVQLGLRFVL